MALIIFTTDLPEGIASHAMASMWVDGANARASRVAPCLESPTDSQLAEAKLVLIGAILRWFEAGSGAFQSKTVGPMGVTFDTSQRSGFKFWPTEITQLQDICKNGSESKAFSIDTVPTGGYHALTCSVNFGAGAACSCGASIAGLPIYEQP